MSSGVLRQFYLSKAWIDLRSCIIVERGPVCEKCQKIFIDTSKLIGHHKEELTPENVHDVSISLNKELIEIICHECHNKEHRRFGHNKRSVYIVYGPPLSGKKTLVNQLMHHGDLIIDMDRIYECISGQPMYIKPNNLRFNVFAVRDKLIDMVKTRYGQWQDAYIIGGYPEKYERDKLADCLRAELIFCEVDKAECYRRLEADEGRKHRSLEWRGYIDKWFSEYAP
ncbi:MAG: hypothetical protein K0R93_1030 [Anaerosolibacter sp.]|jgi:hypothetical protein|uniref:HNH endonuclease n=1 Tax=Anaerosolibacter sp. TaxID=1872527 RepID=UPI002601EAED|nr:HNH endonuclease [Anaerosolibacter sp.]MDF2546132.1 hypothetical protein [Anaerosolibacter sp.]